MVGIIGGHEREDNSGGMAKHVGFRRCHRIGWAIKFETS